MMPESRVTKSKDDQKETTKRGYWDKDIEFILSCIGYAVGLGNIWRFPYLCMRNGGGAFLIPYFIFMVIAGIPLSMMEFSLGQFSSESAATVFKICRLLSGIGWSILIVNSIMVIYYNTIIAWVIYYLVSAFKSWEPLWSKCDNEWNTEHCRLPGVSAAWNGTVFTNNSTGFNITREYYLNTTGDKANVSNSRTYSAGEEFWQFHVLNMTTGISDIGGLRWQLVLCLLAAWTIIFLCVIKGFKSSGKVVYVTATVPYVFLVVILIRGLTLPGARDGILFYISPDWQKLLSFKIWCEACLQIFYSLGPGWGGLITMASYNKFSHNLYSFFAGFVIFSIIGHIAHEGNVPVSEAVTSGPGLAFVAYPEALSKIPGAAIWSVLFFIMLLTVGLDSQFICVETVVSGIVDKFPETLRSRRLIVLIVTVIICCITGLIFVSRAGIYWFQIVDWYGCAYTVLVIAILQCIIICFIYGVNRFSRDIEMMLGKKPNILWKICWCFAIPTLLLMFLFYGYATALTPTYGDYTYPAWAIGFGWSFTVVSCLPILCIFIGYLVFSKGNFVKRLRSTCKPHHSWGPKHDKEEKTTRQHNYPLIEFYG
ncbi:sodium- and chloride-dependent glycine transporter 2-like isoform X2 [Tubulanus polymorphus]|uniref:sodium- and chloride-dependent glycine transporter 2-like isoform X2 n=1 Tax=Tubulanus polymorphus TaxID=672921 RepID=UPI003DA219C3